MHLTSQSPAAVVLVGVLSLVAGAIGALMSAGRELAGE